MINKEDINQKALESIIAEMVEFEQEDRYEEDGFMEFAVSANTPYAQEFVDYLNTFERFKGRIIKRGDSFVNGISISHSMPCSYMRQMYEMFIMTPDGQEMFGNIEERQACRLTCNTFERIYRHF